MIMIGLVSVALIGDIVLLPAFLLSRIGKLRFNGKIREPADPRSVNCSKSRAFETFPP